MPENTVDVEKLFAGYDVLLGGIGPSIEISDFNDQEKDLFNAFIEYATESLKRIDSNIASDFSSQKDLILAFAKVFKAKIGNKPFGGIMPSSSQFGIGLLIPQDIKYVDTPSAEQPAYTDYDGHDWKLSLTAGTPVYLFGSASEYYKANPVVGQRSMIIVLKNGLIEVGTTPSINQIKIETEKINYTPFRLHPLVDVPISKDKAIYQYQTPMAIPIWYDFGIKISAMPIESTTADLRILGVVLYEYGYYSSMKY